MLLGGHKPQRFWLLMCCKNRGLVTCVGVQSSLKFLSKHSLAKARLSLLKASFSVSCCPQLQQIAFSIRAVIVLPQKAMTFAAKLAEWQPVLMHIWICKRHPSRCRLTTTSQPLVGHVSAFGFQSPYMIWIFSALSTTARNRVWGGIRFGRPLVAFILLLGGGFARRILPLIV